MAIQIPKISVNQQVEQDHAPRVDAPKIDAVSPMDTQIGAMEGVAKDAIRLHTEIQHQEADNTATNAANDYMIWRKKRLYGDPESGWEGYANMTGGDPKEMYKQFDKEQEEKLNSLSSPGQDQTWSNETQNLVNRRLSRHFEETQLETLTAYSHQKKKFDDNNSEVNVKLNQQGMYGASGVIVPGDSSSFGMMEAKIAGIRNTLISKGLRDRGAVEDENGDTVYNDGSGPKSVKLTQSVKYAIAKEIATGLEGATKNLVDSRDLDKAKALKEWADDNGYLDRTTLGGLNDKLEKAQLKHDALDYADQAIKNPSILDSIKDPEMRIEAKKYYNEEQRFNEQRKDRQQKAHFEIASKRVDEVMNSATPFAGINQMKDDAEVAAHWDDLNSKQQQALEHRTTAPSKTPSAVTEKWLDLATGQNGKSLRGMSSSDLTLALAGQSPSDQKAGRNLWLKMNSQTGAQLETEYTKMAKELDDQATGARLVRKIPGSDKFIPSDQIAFPLMKKELLDSIDVNHPMTPKERSEFVAKFVLKKKQEAGLGSAPQTMNGGDDKKKQDVANVVGHLTEAARMQYILDYMKDNTVNGKKPEPPHDDQLNEYIAKKAKK